MRYKTALLDKLGKMKSIVKREEELRKEKGETAKEFLDNLKARLKKAKSLTIKTEFGQSLKIKKINGLKNNSYNEWQILTYTKGDPIVQIIKITDIKEIIF